MALIEESIKLNEEEEKQYLKLIQDDYKEAKMLQSVEELGIEKGIEKGVLQTSQKFIVDTLNIRFKNIPETLVKIIRSLDDQALLARLHTEAVLAESVEAFARFVEKKTEIRI